MVSGRLQIRSWTDKDGNKRRTAEIVADNVYFGGNKSTDTNAERTPPSPASDYSTIEGPDEQLPF